MLITCNLTEKDIKTAIKDYCENKCNVKNSMNVKSTELKFENNTFSAIVSGNLESHVDKSKIGFK